MTMLYTGGDCSTTAHCQEEGKVTCQDFNGGPNSEFGAEAYILAMDDGLEETYFEGTVAAGSAYVMENNFERFPADQVSFIRCLRSV
jgi:hypothetical protein